MPKSSRIYISPTDVCQHPERRTPHGAHDVCENCDCAFSGEGGEGGAPIKAYIGWSPAEWDNTETR